MDTFRRRKIAYFSINNPLDKRSWSGITYYLGQSLQAHVGDVDFLGPVPIPWALDKLFRLLQKSSRALLGTEWIPKYSLLKNLYATWYLGRKMRGQHYDFILAPAAGPELAYLRTDTPVVYFGDATYKLYSTFYHKEFANVSALSHWEGHLLEAKALRKSDLVVLTSKWASESAVTDYGVPADRIEIMQFGANIDYVPGAEIIFQKEANPTLTLFFLSVDWERKGGDLALDTLRCLLAQGIEARLVVCGCTPPPGTAHPAMEVIPFLNKNEPADFQRFTELFASVHFLLLPTRADCTPVVNSEANAYGVPAITTDVGGVSGTVIDGVNGYCLPFEADGADYADLLAALYADKPRYHQLIASSRAKFDQELNWDSWAAGFQQLLAKHGL